MKNPLINICLFIFICVIYTSCNAQKQNSSPKSNLHNPMDYLTKLDHIKTGLLDQSGNLWFATTREGVYRYDGKTFKHYSDKDGLPSNYVNCILEDTKGDLWFGTNKGVSKFNGNDFENISMPSDGKPNIWGEICNGNQVLSILEDSQGHLWFGTCGSGVYRYDGKNLESFLAEEGWPQSDSLHRNVIKSMINDHDGNLWFTSLTHGAINKYDGKTMTHFSTKDGLHDDMIFASHQDRSGTYWFGSIQNKDGGLFRSDGKTFEHIQLDDGVCDNFIMGFFQDQSGLLWIKTGTKLCTFDGENFQNFMTEDVEALHDISMVIQDKDGKMWFGGQYGQLWKYDGERLIDFKNKGH